MARSSKRKRKGSRRGKNIKGKLTAIGLRVDANDIARLHNGDRVPAARLRVQGMVGGKVSLEESNADYRKEHDALARKVFLSVAVLVVLSFFSLCFMGASGQYYPYSGAYHMYTPVDVARAIGENVYNAVASTTHLYEPHTVEYVVENFPGYWAIVDRAGVIAITLICAVLLSVSGMLYQTVFKNPIAGPGMLGVSSGVNFGMMLLVAVFGTAQGTTLGIRYALCYGCGGVILGLVLLAGRKLAGKGQKFDVTSMLLIGMIISQLFGFIVSYITLYVMDDTAYTTYYTLSQMLTVDTSALSWIVLGVATVVSLVPVIALRYKFTALDLDDADIRTLGLSATRLRVIALVCGAIMVLAAQIHIGMVSLVSIIVPFLSRAFFGSEFNKQLIGSVCIGTILLLVCRDIVDAIPFVGDGLAIGSVVAVVALPIFIFIMARHLRGWN